MVTRIQDFYQEIGYVGGSAPERVVEWPGMTTKDEKELLYAIGKCYFSGVGSIVEAGVFLGAATNAFASGIRDNFRFGSEIVPGKIIHSYEIGIWDSHGFDKYVNDNRILLSALGEKRYSDGENYVPLLEALLHDHLDLVHFEIGDVAKLIHSDGPVEIAFYDCLKNYERDYAVFRALTKHFIPGRTIIVQQDYFYEGAIDNKLRQEYFSDYFTFLGSVQTSGVFRYEKEIPPSAITNDPLLSITYSERINLLENAAARIDMLDFNLYTQLGVVALMVREAAFLDADRRLTDIERQLHERRSTPRTYDIVTAFRRTITKNML